MIIGCAIVSIEQIQFYKETTRISSSIEHKFDNHRVGGDTAAKQWDWLMRRCTRYIMIPNLKSIATAKRHDAISSHSHGCPSRCPCWRNIKISID